ncbi:MAG: hypothetical protein GX825_09150, partial [Syntrophomonadaceae bacterium]|nr:hypothetical protein [Syntrophomonadaceae bacterium]
MKRFVTILIIIILAFTVGCWDRTEIIDLGIVVGLALDKGEKPDEVVSTIQIANSQAFLPGGASGSDEPFWTASGKGKTVREAIEKMDYRIPKILFFGQNRLLIIGEEAARGGIDPYLDRVWRSKGVRANIFVAIAKGTGKEILEVAMPTFQSSAMAMVSLFNLGNRGAIIPMTLAEFSYDIGTGRGGAVAPMVAS